MSSPALAGITTLLFDVMGTVVDDEGGVRRDLADAGVEDVETAATRWDAELTARMTQVNEGRRAWAGHRELRREALVAVTDEGTVPRPAEDTIDHLVSVVERYDAWPDSVAAVGTLREYVAVVALSNADLSELTAMALRTGLAWHAVLPGQVSQRYKPDASVYRNALDVLELDPARTLMVAAHAWDLRAAAEHGLATAFVARPGATPPRDDDRFTVQVADLAELAELIAAR